MKLAKDQALIFDMDGVLVDSMVYHCRAWQKAGELNGLIIDSEDVYLHEGEKGFESARFFFQKNGKQADEEEINKILRDKERIFSTISQPHVYPCIEELLKDLTSANYLIGLVTGTSMAEVQKVLPASLMHYFKVIVAGDQVTCGKPFPEPYLTALKRLGKKPSEAIVIENAPYGILSAKRAGIYCIALCTSLSPEHLSMADLILNTHNDLYAFLLEAIQSSK